MSNISSNPVERSGATALNQSQQKKATAVKNMSRSEAGRLGARALNQDPQKKSTAAKKAAETRKKDNPNVFRQMGAKGGGAHGKVKTDDKIIGGDNAGNQSS